MGDMLIRGVPDALKREIEAAARECGESLSSTAIDLLRKGLRDESSPKQSAWDVLRATFEEFGPVDGSFAEVLDEIEAERKGYYRRGQDTQP